MLEIIVLWMLLVMDATPWWCYFLLGAHLIKRFICYCMRLAKEANA